MHRFYIPADRWNPDRLILDEAESHHALDVLRMKEGAKAVLFNGAGTEATAELVGARKTGVEFKRLQIARTPPLSCQITLGQAIPKGKNMDLIIQKGTELGAAAIVPLLSERTVVQCDAEEGIRKLEKWRTVAIEAAKQCGQNWLPTIQTPVTPKAFFASSARYDLMLIASLQPGALHLKSLLGEFGDKLPKRVLVLVGPEGDFTPAEISLARSQGCRPITLGPIVLRTETAALYCLSVLSYELLGTA
jgi:16S rRNA (uracil1498-N3)-methyltransferase